MKVVLFWIGCIFFFPATVFLVLAIKYLFSIESARMGEKDEDWRRWILFIFLVFTLLSVGAYLLINTL
jgi:hypothetical protein